MKKLTRKLLIACLLCVVPLLLNAAKVGLLHLKAVGVDDAMAEAVADLLVNDLINYGHQILNPEAMDAAAGEVLKCYEAQCAAEAGFKAQVERVIYGSVSKLGEKHMLQVAVVNVSTREIVWSGSAAAKTAEDLDVVVKRIAKAIHEGKKVEEGAEVGLITEQETTQEAKRKESFFAVGGSFSYGLPLHGYADAGGLIGGSLISWYETPSFIVELNIIWLNSMNAIATGTITDEPSIMENGAELSFFKVTSKGDFAPYFGGGMGPRMLVMNAGYESFGTNIGMGFNIGGGLLLLRTYDFHVVIDARYSLNTAAIPNYTGPHGTFNLSVGLVYPPKKRAGGCFGGGCLGPGFGGGGGCW